MENGCLHVFPGAYCIVKLTFRPAGFDHRIAQFTIKGPGGREYGVSCEGWESIN